MAKKILLFWLVFNFGAFVSTKVAFAQESTDKAVAKFDVIIKTNGEIIYGLVKEVSATEIKYQRTDIPDGPIYSILKKDVYAISYRNQLKEIINPVDSTIFKPHPTQPQLSVHPAKPILDFEHGELSIQSGFIRGFSKLSHPNQYQSSLGFPSIILGYDISFKKPWRLGLNLGYAQQNFTKDEFNTYDSTQINSHVKEKKMLANLYLKRRFGTGAIQPFILGGVGLNSSLIQSTSEVSLSYQSARKVLVTSTGRSTGLALQIRGGLSYLVSSTSDLQLSMGSGLNIVQLGITFKL